MALGNTYGSNGRDNDYSPTVYSSYRVNNGESRLDPTCLTFSFWKQSLKIGICPRRQTGNSEEFSFDMENGVFIYLNHTKARILLNELKRFMADPEANTGCGVPSGKQGLITFHTGSEFGVQNPVVCIRKVDESGVVNTSIAYEFKCDDYYFSVRGYKENSDFQKAFDDYRSLELEQFATLLEEYYKAQTQAVAATVATQQSYPLERLQGRLNSICDKLGIESYRGSGRSGYDSKSSFFNRSSGSSSGSSTGSSQPYEQASLDDIY